MQRDFVIAVCNSKGIHDCIFSPYSIKTSEILERKKTLLPNLQALVVISKKRYLTQEIIPTQTENGN